MIGNLPKMVDCPHCSGRVPFENGKLAEHNYGDWPDWIDNRRCPRSGKGLIRRKPKMRWRKAKRRG